MVEEKKKSKNLVKDVSFRVVKAALKAILVYLLYFFLAPMLAPLFGLLPGDLAERTIFQYFFSTARALFFMAYLLLSMGNGLISTNYENFSLTVNLTLFYTIAVSLSLLGFASSILQAINFMSERAEETSGLQPPQKA
jgi:hypothetical protein